MRSLTSCLVLWLGAWAAGGALADPAPFYEGKTLAISVGASAGGGYDLYGRALARYIGRYIPGHPSVVVRNMPGAGGLLLASYLFNVAPKDGTEIGEFENSTVFTRVLTGTEVKFDPTQFGWLGSLDKFTPIAVAWRSAPVHVASELFERSMTVGASGAGSSSAGYPYSLNGILGTKFKVVNGYPGSAEMTLAIERGELDGIVSWCWTCMKSEKPDWIKEKKARVLMQLAFEGDPELNAMGVPLVLQFAKTEDQKRMLRVVFAMAGFARPFTAPPGLPPERLAVLREAFRKAAQDPDLIAEMQARGNTAQYVAPGKIAALLADAAALDQGTLATIQAAYSGKGQQ